MRFQNVFVNFAFLREYDPPYCRWRSGDVNGTGLGEEGGTVGEKKERMGGEGGGGKQVGVLDRARTLDRWGRMGMSVGGG